MHESKQSSHQNTAGIMDADPYNEEKPIYGKRNLKTFAVYFAIWAIMTVYIIFVSIRGQSKDGFALAIILYIFISLRLLAKYVCMTKIVYRPLGCFVDATIVRVASKISLMYRLIILAITLAIIMVVIIVIEPATEYGNMMQRFQSLLGVAVCLAALYATSIDRKAVPWDTVIVGMTLVRMFFNNVQNYLIALFVLKTEYGAQLFSGFSHLITMFLKFSDYGIEFLFVFFCSFISVVYYLGGMQYIVAKFAWFFCGLMNTSGAESVVAVASPFIGQGESALLVKPFVQYMTKSELHSTMCSGFSTISGSVLLAYQQFLGDTSVILTACVMSVPTSLLVSKMRYPEKEHSITKGHVSIPKGEDEEANLLHAASNGSAVGIQLVLVIGAALLAIVALFNLTDFLFGWLFYILDIYDTVSSPKADGSPRWVTIQVALSYVFFPIAFLLGIPLQDCRKAGEFMALKSVVNEFVAYSDLTDYAIKEGHPGNFTPRSMNIADYIIAVKLLAFALCGFANVSSIGVQIACLSAMAPSRSKDLARLAFSAMLTGTISTWLCASIAGTLL